MMQINSEEVSCCVGKGQGHSSVEIPEGHSSTEIPEAQGHSSVEIPEGYSSTQIPEAQGHSSVEIPEARSHSGDSSVEMPEDLPAFLVFLQQRTSDINTVPSDKPVDSTKAFIFLDCNGVEEVRVGPHQYIPGPMFRLKVSCLANVIRLSRTNLIQYWQRMLPHIGEIINSYDGSDCPECSKGIWTWKDGYLLSTMILDGCFILEFFRFQFFMSLQNKTTMKDHPFAQVERRKLPIIFRDLLQLGNQIPFPVLEQLFQICHPLFGKENEKRLLNIIGAVSLDALGVGRDYVRRFSSDPEAFERKFRFGDLKPLHLLDLVRFFNSPCFVKQDASGDSLQWNITLHDENVPNISKLRMSGIKVNLQNQDHYLEIAFQDGAIKMPKITLNELMCSFLKNCTELEHRCTSASKPISSYVLLLDNLVDTADDIDYLRQHRVLEHRKKTNKEAADFINNLGTNINFDGIDPNFFILRSDVNKYYLSEPRRKWVSFKSEYIEKPWLVISVLAASVLLILTCIQTHYAIHPQK